MKGKVMGIASGSDYTDGDRRVEIVIEGADAMFRRLRIPQKLLRMDNLQLDDDVIVDIYLTPAPAAVPEIKKAAK